MTSSAQASCWEGLVNEAWDREPFLIRAGFPSVISELELLAVFRQLFDRVRAVPLGALPGRDARSLCYIGTDDHSLPIETVDLYPAPGDATLRDWYQRNYDSLGNDFLLAVYNLQSYSRELWLRLCALLGPLISKIGSPPHGLQCSTFVGRYKSTPFGIHTDVAHVVTIGLQGTKRFELWNSQPRNGERPDYTFDIGLGDVLYWAPKHWHLARNDDFSATIAIMWLPKEPTDPGEPAFQRWLTDIVSARANERALDVPVGARSQELLRAARSRFLESMEGQGFRDLVWKGWLERMSALSFRAIPQWPPLHIHPDEPMETNSHVSLEWVRLSSGRLSCAANGQSFEIDVTQDVKRLVDRMTSPRPWTLAQLTGEFEGVLDSSEIRRIVDECARLHVVVRTSSRRA